MGGERKDNEKQGGQRIGKESGKKNGAKKWGNQRKIAVGKLEPDFGSTFEVIEAPAHSVELCISAPYF